MPAVTEKARAKINLTLTILGRRSDGYHALLSLVAFADVADIVTLDPGAATGVTVAGPFADAISAPNLVETALRIVSEHLPGLEIGHVTLDKQLPVASGIGGGSADAAAALRAIRTAHPQATADLDWMSIARRLGADVPVCFADRAVWMSAVGDHLHDLSSPLPQLHAVLVNPRSPVPGDKTARVFRALGAPPISGSGDGVATARPAIPDRDELLALMHRMGNDLEAPATAVVPQVQDVLAALETCSGAEIAHLSGAGPTCFAVFPNKALATAAAASLVATHPSWWIVPTVIG
jgi:4-diphosphocytidyl-2-C-methyl-D-erythritol kinase